MKGNDLERLSLKKGSEDGPFPCQQQHGLVFTFQLIKIVTEDDNIIEIFIVS